MLQTRIRKISVYNQIDIDRKDHPTCYLVINRIRVFQGSDEFVSKHFYELEKKIRKFEEMASHASTDMSVISQMRLEKYDRIFQ